MPEIFPGFNPPERNWRKLPHSFIETLAARDNLAEVKVVLYVLRHTWGFQECERGKRITLDEFVHGRKQMDGSRIDSGTGLCLNSVKAGVRKAVEHGLLVQEPDGRQDNGRASHVYRLRFAPAKVSEIDTRSGKETKERNYRKTGPQAVPKRVRCSIPRTMMKKRSNEDGEIWYSHKTGSGEWCQGAPGDVPEVERMSVSIVCGTSVGRTAVSLSSDRQQLIAPCSALPTVWTGGHSGAAVCVPADGFYLCGESSSSSEPITGPAPEHDDAAILASVAELAVS